MKPRSKTIEARRKNRAKRAPKNPEGARALTFSALVQTIASTHSHFAARASLAINVGLTLRNWTVGCHIQEFEQRGEERAKYGVGLFEDLSARLRQTKDIKYHPRELRRCRQFYNAYSQIRGTLSPESRELLVFSTPQLAQPPSAGPLGVPADRLLMTLSFSHFLELLEIEDPIKRAFYETEAIRGNWTVRELSRQIGALLFERTALSRSKRRVVDQVQEVAETATPENTILCSSKDQALVEYALPGLDAQLFVSRYQLELPKKDELERFLTAQVSSLAVDRERASAHAAGADV